MKIFHLSDLHIGLHLLERDLWEDQLYIFKMVTEYARQEKPDAVLIAGDIYDKAVPSAEAVELFDFFATSLREAVPDCVIMMISGNHDSAPRVNVFRNVLSHQNIHMIGLPPEKPEDKIEKVTLQDAWGNVNFYLLPFVKPSMVKQIVGTDQNGNNLSYNDSVHRLIDREELKNDERNVLVSHQFYLLSGTAAEDVQRMDSEIVTVGNIDQVNGDILERFDYAALGHIHKPMQLGCESFRYCGTPLACSVSEAGQQKGIVLAELREKGNVQTRVLPLNPLRQVRIIKGSLMEVLAQACDDYVTVILTDSPSESLQDMQDRIHTSFPYLLEIRREYERAIDYDRIQEEKKQLNPFELCRAFLNGTDEAQLALLKEVINFVQEADR